MQRRDEHSEDVQRPDDEPVLPQVPDDERDLGWGDHPDGRRDADWYRRERPPHHE